MWTVFWMVIWIRLSTVISSGLPLAGKQPENATEEME